MPEIPTLPQLSVLALSFFALGIGIVLSVLRSHGNEKLRVPMKMLYYWGLSLGIVVVFWHTASRGRWTPLESNFDTLVSLGVILGIFLMYVQKRRPVAGLDWFVMPMVMLLLLLGGVFGRTKLHAYLPTAWSVLHLIGVFGGAVAFALAGASGAMYLLSNQRLRNKTALPGPKFASLERLEHVTYLSVTLGFALLTSGAIMGFIWLLRDEKKVLPPGKVILTGVIWVIYAAILHTPINPSFRGRKTAILSIAGFVIMIATVVAVQFVPSGK